MSVPLNTLLLVLSLITMFFYQLSTFSYATGLLVGGKRNKWLFALVAFVNTLLFATTQHAQMPFHMLIVGFFIVLVIEFKLISKTDIIQVICGASIFALHIAALATPLIIIFSNLLKVSPNEITNDTYYAHIIVIIICVVLTLAHEIVKKYIDNTSIQRVTVKSRHSVILLASIALIVLFQVTHSATMINDIIYYEQILLSLTVSFASLLIFYLFFLYAINLVDASLYKRYSDKVIGEQQKISEQEKSLITKIERDDLTGVFNRRYIMNLLEDMCKEDSTYDAFYVLFIDINALKYTNDTYGHKAGDRLIIKIAHAIVNTVREHDIVARIGGDEFLVVMPQFHIESYDNVIERILQYIDRQNETEEFLVSASIGSIYVDDNVKKQGVNYILSTADEDMRKNKARFYENRKGDNL